MARLCFGTFAQVLRLCKRDGVTDYELVGSMTRTVDPDCQYANPANKTPVSRLFSCEGNLSDGRKTGGSGAVMKPGESLSQVKLLAPNFEVAEIVDEFAANVVTLIDEDRKRHVVLALLEIIRNDAEIEGSKRLNFEKYVGTTKNALLSQDVYGLADLFAGIFLYTVVAVKNTVGKKYVKNLTFEYLKGFDDKAPLMRIIDKYSALTDINATKPSLISDEGSSVSTSGNHIDAAFFVYLSSVKGKYDTMKTLLYNEQPKPFYDFYVCNDIERRISIPGKYSTKYSVSIITNASLSSLLECSRFVILAGTGGLGKSMMMRHLLLNAIENYEEHRIVPIFIPLKDFDETIDNLFDYVYAKFCNHCADISEDDFEDALSKGKCLLLFDGLDEIGSAYAKRFERDLEDFTDKFPENAFIISSRPYQTFVSYSRFAVLRLRPFSKEQALMLVDNLEFRIDEPIIKAKFRTELNNNLYLSHRAFTENPLLLTIMLLTFEQYAEVPSKMHLFYREAFAALSVKHDASKGAYKRVLKTGLTADRFADYFAEICSRSYYDEKFEMTEDEFSKYYDILKEREKTDDTDTEAKDYLHDLCSNMCLMYFEGGKYHFTHRSFQEYFCALYFSKQKDKNLKDIGNFFEYRRNRMYGDKTFNMLYDMISEKVEEYIFLPYLSNLFKKCDNGDGYWTFLETIYPTLSYEEGETDDFITNIPQSYLYDFIKNLCCVGYVTLVNFPHYEDLVTGKYVYVTDESEDLVLVNEDEVDSDYVYEYGSPDIAGWRFEFDVTDVRSRPDDCSELLQLLNEDGFALREEYSAIREYYEKLKAKQKPTGSSLFDLF